MQRRYYNEMLYIKVIQQENSSLFLQSVYVFKSLMEDNVLEQICKFALTLTVLVTTIDALQHFETG